MDPLGVTVARALINVQAGGFLGLDGSEVHLMTLAGGSISADRLDEAIWVVHAEAL